jgi:hypothetical protein
MLLLLLIPASRRDAAKAAVQLDEVDELLAAVDEWCARFRSNAPPPVIIAGDFNNGPGSAPYRKMVDAGYASAYLRYPDADPARPAVDGAPPACGHDAPLTTCSFRRTWTVDFIWYRSGGGGGGAHADAAAAAAAADTGLAPTHLLRVPPEASLRADAGPEGWVERENALRAREGVLPLDMGGAAGGLGHGGIPNRAYPSDHVPLATRFSWR